MSQYIFAHYCVFLKIKCIRMILKLQILIKQKIQFLRNIVILRRILILAYKMISNYLDHKWDALKFYLKNNIKSCHIMLAIIRLQ